MAIVLFLLIRCICGSSFSLLLLVSNFFLLLVVSCLSTDTHGHNKTNPLDGVATINLLPLRGHHLVGEINIATMGLAPM